MEQWIWCKKSHWKRNNDLYFNDETVYFFNRTFNNPNFDPNRNGRNATHQLTQFLGVTGYPTVVFFSENADPIMPLVGYYKPQQIELFLKMIKQGDYQVFTKPEDFENYQKNFRPRFRGWKTI